MVLIYDGNSEIGEHGRINLCYLICLRHSLRSRIVANLKFIINHIIIHKKTYSMSGIACLALKIITQPRKDYTTIIPIINFSSDGEGGLSVSI